MLLTMESKICLGGVRHLTSHRVEISFRIPTIRNSLNMVKFVKYRIVS